MTREEFEEKVSRYVRFWLKEFEKPLEEQKPLEEPVRVDVVLTCRSEGCPLRDLSYWHRVEVPFDGVYKVLCAPCNSAVEDLDPMFEDDADFRFPTRYADGSSWLKEAW